MPSAKRDHFSSNEHRPALVVHMEERSPIKIKMRVDIGEGKYDVLIIKHIELL